MKSKSIQFLLLTIFAVIVGGSSLTAQSDLPRQSPKMTATGKIGEANVTITYGSPSVKGRKIWGELVPYGKVWRAGANEATVFETDRDVKIAGKDLKKGKYSIYTIPNESEWQIIFNSEFGQWGITRAGETTRNPEKDMFIIKVKPVKIDLKESLEYKVNATGFSLAWEALQVFIPVQ